MTDHDIPDSPITSLDQGAVQLHELYTCYMDAGFSEARAFDLVALTLDHFLSGD